MNSVTAHPMPPHATVNTLPEHLLSIQFESSQINQPQARPLGAHVYQQLKPNCPHKRHLNESGQNVYTLAFFCFVSPISSSLLPHMRGAMHHLISCYITGHRCLFKSNQINSVPRLHSSHFQCSGATCG